MRSSCWAGQPQRLPRGADMFDGKRVVVLCVDDEGRSGQYGDERSSDTGCVGAAEKLDTETTFHVTTGTDSLFIAENSCMGHALRVGGLYLCEEESDIAHNEKMQRRSCSISDKLANKKKLASTGKTLTAAKSGNKPSSQSSKTIYGRNHDDEEDEEDSELEMLVTQNTVAHNALRVSADVLPDARRSKKRLRSDIGDEDDDRSDDFEAADESDEEMERSILMPHHFTHSETLDSGQTMMRETRDSEVKERITDESILQECLYAGKKAICDEMMKREDALTAIAARYSASDVSSKDDGYTHVIYKKWIKPFKSI